MAVTLRKETFSEDYEAHTLTIDLVPQLGSIEVCSCSTQYSPAGRDWKLLRVDEDTALYWRAVQP